MSTARASTDPATIVRRSLFFMVLVALTLGNLFTMFSGLDSPQAMDQAQIAREIARGNGDVTKFIRPVAYAQNKEAKKAAVSFEGFQDTYQAPLNPLIYAAVIRLMGAQDPESPLATMQPNEWVYALDRVIAAVCTIFFLVAMGMTYLLVARIFDGKIAAVTALIMLFCETFWQYSMSGLPQMLMLALFSCALYFAYRAVEATSEGRVAMAPAAISGIFFALLALAHWMTVWIAIGYIIFAAIAFRPRGLVAAVILSLVAVPCVVVMFWNHHISGSPFGVAFLTLHSGLGGSEDEVMRSTDVLQSIEITYLMSKILRTTLQQGTQIIPLLAGIVVAPVFFISLFHSFKRASIGAFRWAILLMWVFTALGLAFFGVRSEGIDPNQLHLLFAPIMTAYGLAFISILWNRLDVVAANPVLRNVHYVLIVLLCAVPLIVSLPLKIRIGLQNRERGGFPHWPPYWPQALNGKLKHIIPANRMLYSDQPWAVAWYADRTCIWLPRELKDFDYIQSAAASVDSEPVGIYITPSSYATNNMLEIQAKFRDFTPLILESRTMTALPGAMVTLFDKAPDLANIYKLYPYRIPLLQNNAMMAMLYSDKLVQVDEPKEGKP